MSKKASLGMCRALDIHGRRCRKRAVCIQRYHGSPELYSWFEGQPTWVVVELCEAHAWKSRTDKRGKPRP